MNYQDYIKYDPEKKQYTDSYGYVIDGVSSKVIPTELTTAGEAISIANSAAATANAAVASIGAVSGGNFQTVTAGYGLTNQLAITTVSGTATLTPSGTDANINVTINPKGTGGYLKIGSNYSKCISISTGGNNKITTSQGSNADGDLTLESKGAGKLILANDNNGNTFETLEIVHANGSSTITTKSQFPGTYPSGDINFVPRGIGAVTSTGPIVSSYGYFCAKRTSQKVLNNSANYIDFDTVVTNTFGSSYWTSNNRFTNLSGKTIKVMAQAFGFPVTVPSGGNGESMFELYNSSNTLIGRYGRILYYWVDNSSPYNGVSPCGVFMMAPNDYIKLIIHCNGITWTLNGAAGYPGEYNNWTIAQIP